MPKPIQGATYAVWLKWMTWQLEWENAILRYRDGNTSSTEDD